MNLRGVLTWTLYLCYSFATETEVLINSNKCGEINSRGDAIVGQVVTYCFTPKYRPQIMSSSYKWEGRINGSKWHEQKATTWTERNGNTRTTGSADNNDNGGIGCIKLFQPQKYWRVRVRLFDGQKYICKIGFPVELQGRITTVMTTTTEKNYHMTSSINDHVHNQDKNSSKMKTSTQPVPATKLNTTTVTINEATDEVDQQIHTKTDEENEPEQTPTVVKDTVPIPTSNIGMTTSTTTTSIRTTTPTGQTNRSAPTEETNRLAPTEGTDRSAPTEETNRPAPTGQTNRSAPTGQTNRSAPTEETNRSAPTEETNRPARTEETNRSAPTGQTFRPAPTGEANRSAPIGEPNRSAPTGETNRSATTGETDRSAPTGETDRSATDKPGSPPVSTNPHTSSSIEASTRLKHEPITEQHVHQTKNYRSNSVHPSKTTLHQESSTNPNLQPTTNRQRPEVRANLPNSDLVTGSDKQTTMVLTTTVPVKEITNTVFITQMPGTNVGDRPVTMATTDTDDATILVWKIIALTNGIVLLVALLVIFFLGLKVTAKRDTEQKGDYAVTCEQIQAINNIQTESNVLHSIVEEDVQKPKSAGELLYADLDIDHLKAMSAANRNNAFKPKKSDQVEYTTIDHLRTAQMKKEFESPL